MEPKHDERTVFQVTEEGVLGTYITNASSYEVARASDTVKSFEKLKEALKNQGYHVFPYFKHLHVYFDEPSDSANPQEKIG